MINIDKPIMPPVVTYVNRAFETINKDDIVILRIDTPGGLVVSAEKIIKIIFGLMILNQR